jgi:peptidoglycan/LPS O-acetylase OafA/YrhL
MPSVPTPTPDQPGPAPASETSRIVGIDGLRALAVLGVMVFHADWFYAQGGFFGVDLFFVISGFLITRLLLAELDRSGTISFRGFYLRRARRILPAMLLVIAGSALAAVVLAPDALPLLRVDALASALFVVNWHFIFQELSYFEYIGRQPLLQHLWSLAIEEQFYLLWPLIVLALASRGGRRLLGVVALALAAASAVWMGVLADRLGFPESMDIGRVYFGTDTHAMGLLAGAALAAAAPGISAWAHAAVDEGGGVRRTGTLLGIAGLAGTLFLFSQVSENHPWLYPWAFVASAVFSMAAIVACLMPGPFGALLDAQPLRWIGERSYGIYLWHWPVFMLTRPGVDIPLEQGPAFALRCALTFALAAASYRFIEAPILGRSLRPMPVTPQFARGALAAFACAALFILVPSPQGAGSPGAKAAAQGATGVVTGAAPAAGTPTNPPPPAAPATAATTTDRAPPPLIGRRSGQLTVVGDSVALGARSAIERGIDGADPSRYQRLCHREAAARHARAAARPRACAGDELARAAALDGGQQPVVGDGGAPVSERRADRLARHRRPQAGVLRAGRRAPHRLRHAGLRRRGGRGRRFQQGAAAGRSARRAATAALADHARGHRA